MRLGLPDWMNRVPVVHLHFPLATRSYSIPASTWTGGPPRAPRHSRRSRLFGSMPARRFTEPAGELIHVNRTIGASVQPIGSCRKVQGLLDSPNRVVLIRR